MKHLTRRGFLKSSAVTLPGLMLFGKNAFSITNQDPHFFVMLVAEGGMDATLGLDPQLMPNDGTASDIFLEYRPEDIIHVLGLKLGPTAKALAPFANKCSILNGLLMKRDAGHPPLLQYMQTGRGDSTAATLPIELAATFGAGPYGVLFNGTTFSAKRTVPLTTIDDIMKEPSGILLSDILKPLEPNPDQISPLAIAIRNIISSRSITIKLLQALKEVAKDHADAPPAIQALLASFSSGACQQAIIDIVPRGRLDTHSSHERNHFREQTRVWNNVADLFKRFEKTQFMNGNLMDYTTFMVVTEFSRTPYLNGAKGKDHNPDTNSVLFAGKGVQGGNTIGSSKVIVAKKSVTGSPLHIATAIDPKTGQPAQGPNGATFILPENVVSTVADIFGNPKGHWAVEAKIPPIAGIKA